MNTDNLLKQILHPNNLNQAYLQVKRNKGAAGVDGMTINELGHYLKENGEEIKDQIRTRSYQPNRDSQGRWGCAKFRCPNRG